MKHLFSISFFLLPPILVAQDKLLLTKNFLFEDGVFLNFEEFKSNQPSLSWSEVESNYFISSQTFLVQVEYIIRNENGQAEALDLSTVWAISIEGIPYLRLQQSDIHKELTTFAALRVRGKICYFAYPDSRVKKVKISAYNPLNGLPFRTAELERDEEIVVEKMLHFETGEIMEFSLSNFLNWIDDDPKLKSTIEELSVKEAEEKLFKSLLIYDDRNEVYLKSDQ